MSNNVLTELEHDTLKEVVCIGAGGASSALSKMIHMPVTITVPNLWFIPIEEVAGLMGGVEQIMTTLAVKIGGEVSGIVLFLLTEDAARKLASAVAPIEKQLVLEETFNIIVGTSLTSLGNFLKLNLSQSVPASATDMLRAVINEVVSPLGEQNDQVLLLKVDFLVEDLAVTGDFYFIFDPASSEKILAICQQAMTKSNG